jgi:hypothetical protein
VIPYPIILILIVGVSFTLGGLAGWARGNRGASALLRANNADAILILGRKRPTAPGEIPEPFVVLPSTITPEGAGVLLSMIWHHLAEVTLDREGAVEALNEFHDLISCCAAPASAYEDEDEDEGEDEGPSE